MKRCALVLGLLSILLLPADVRALGFVVVGNEPLDAGRGLGKELLATVNVEERVYFLSHDWSLAFYFKGGPKALNQALRRFVEIPADKREIILLPAPATPLNCNGKSIGYDWCLRVPGTREGIAGRRVAVVDSEVADNRTTLTVYIPEPLPGPLADPKAARKWIADLGNNDFKTRDRAARELADLGPPVAALLRDALKGGPSAEARDRMERILADVSREIRVDVLEIPQGVPVASLDTILARARKELANKDPSVRGDAAWVLANYGFSTEEILPDLEKVLKTEKATWALAGAAWAAYQLGPAARPLLPYLRETAKSTDANVYIRSNQAIDNIEKGKVDSVSDKEAKRRATIRKEIREYVKDKANRER